MTTTKSHREKRRFSGPGPRPDRKQNKREAAEESQAAWRALTTGEQLKALDDRLGIGVGARKQRARLARMQKVGGEDAPKSKTPKTPKTPKATRAA